jgi:glucokinase-like ROK family protein
MQQIFGTGDQTFVRELNLSSVLRLLQTNKPLSRAQIASLTGLHKSTVSSLVEELIDRRLVHETGILSGGAGRPSTQLDLNPRAGGIIGVEFGVDFVSVVLTDFVGVILWRREETADPMDKPEVMIRQILGLVDQAAQEGRARGMRLLGLGLTTPGTVNNDGLLVFAPNLQWREVPLKQIFQEHIGLPVFVDNDANAAALGEHLFGVARQAQNFIFVFAGVGIGGGLFLNGDIYRGTGGYAGEIGHSTFMVESFQNPCQCGNRGCWETYANQYSILERVRARLALKRTSLIPKLMAEQHSPLNLAIVTMAAEADDAEALETLQEAGAAMGLGVANLINIFNPEMIILGGPLSAAGKFLLPAIQAAVDKRAMPDIRGQADIALSAFGPYASLMGAVSMVVDYVLTHPSHIDRREVISG